MVMEIFQDYFNLNKKEFELLKSSNSFVFKWQREGDSNPRQHGYELLRYYFLDFLKSLIYQGKTKVNVNSPSDTNYHILS